MYPSLFNKVIVVRGRETWKHNAKVQRLFFDKCTIFEPNTFKIHHWACVSSRFLFIFIVLIIIQEYFPIRLQHWEVEWATFFEFKQVSRFMTESELSGTSKRYQSLFPFLEGRVLVMAVNGASLGNSVWSSSALVSIFMQIFKEDEKEN